MKGNYIRLRSASSIGSALLPVLIFILLVTILLSTVILYGSYHSTLILRNTDEIKAYYLAETSLQYALKEISENNQDFMTHVFEEQIKGIGRIEYQIEEYGVYLLCRARGYAGKKMVELKGLLGAIPGDGFSKAINLGGADYPLVVSGNTRITGDVAVGASGVITGKYKGKGYKGANLVNGRITRNQIMRLPLVDKSSLYSYIDLLESASPNFERTFDSYFHISDKNLNEIKNLKRAKFSSGLNIDIQEGLLDLDDAIFEVNGDLGIKGKSIVSGFGTILVDGDVVIRDNTILRDIIIICKGVVSIENNAIIKCQIISSDQILLFDSSAVEWPGVLAVNVGEESGRIECNSKKTSEGTMILLSEFSGENVWGSNLLVPRIIIYPGQIWKGPIYSESFVTAQGTVAGNISTNGFYIYSEPTAYINWLVDAMVSSDSSLSSRIIPFLFKNRRQVAYSHYY